jgi:hypothetical protein
MVQHLLGRHPKQATPSTYFQPTSPVAVGPLDLAPAIWRPGPALCRHPAARDPKVTGSTVPRVRRGSLSWPAPGWEIM